MKPSGVRIIVAILIFFSKPEHLSLGVRLKILLIVASENRCNLIGHKLIFCCFLLKACNQSELLCPMFSLPPVRVCGWPALAVN